MQVSNIQKKIFNMAFLGELTKHDFNESFEEDYIKIKEEKNTLPKKEVIITNKILPDEDLIELPKGWKMIRLGNIAKVISKGTTPSGGQSAYKKSGINYLRAEGVNTYIDQNTFQYIDEKTHNNALKRSILQSGDILVTIAGTLGKTGIVRDIDLPLNTNQAVAFIRLVNKNLVMPEYIMYALKSDFVQRQFFDQKKDSAIPNLTLEIITNTLIAIPPLKEQQEICNIIRSINEKINMLEKHHDRLLLYKNMMIKKVINEAIYQNSDEYETDLLGNILVYEQPTKYIVESEKYSDEYAIPVLTAGKTFILGYTNEKNNIFDKIPVIIFDDFTTASQYVDFPFKVKSSAMKILNCNPNMNIKFYYYLLQSINYDSSTHKRYWISEFAPMVVPVPPKDEQDKIVEKVEQLLNLIDQI